MTPTNLDKLEAIARAANDERNEKWEQIQSLKGPAVALGKGHNDIIAHNYHVANHIAAFDPPTVLALIAEIREMRSVLEDISKREGDFPYARDIRTLAFEALANLEAMRGDK